MDKRILICTIESWNSRVGANTFSALFAGYSSEKLANLYIREEIPDNPCCSRYFQISEMKVIRSIFRRKCKTGKEIEVGKAAGKTDFADLNRSKELYDKNRKKRSYFKLCIRELLWLLSAWKSSELKGFIEDYKPDIIVFGMEGYIHFNRICRYIVERSGAKAVGYFWDDNFTYKQMKNKFGYLFLRFFQRRSLIKTAAVCDAFWAITEKTKQEADEFFHIDCTVLTKPIDYMPGEQWRKSKLHHPIRMLYTGNLLIGRFESIKAISRALERINAEEEKIMLDIYSASYIPSEELEILCRHVRICGCVGQNEVERLQKNADILLFVEAYNGEFAKKARLSFSTKLTDYYRSGKCIFAVGAYDVAPMEYMMQNEIAVCATNEKEIYEKLFRLVNEPELIEEYGKRAFLFGQENHSRALIQSKVDATFDRL